jgi:hypothetical protein
VAVVAAPGIAHADLPGGGGSGSPTGPGGTGGTTTPTTKKVIHLPDLKIEIKTVDGQPPKIKYVPFPGLHRPTPTQY